MKLNVGCGNRRIPGYTGVDIVAREAADIVAPAYDIPLPDGSVDEIFACHVWEHFRLWECDDVIKEWRRLLKPGGALILELPNIIKCCQNLLSGRMRGGKHPHQLSYHGIFGDPRGKDPWMGHAWGWSPETLTEFLQVNGFGSIIETPTQWHPAGRNHRDMRIEARKQENG